jgi:CDP-diacylglycerol---serine O-phosphatidyltransferase
LPLVLQQYDTGWMYELLSNSYVLIALSILSALIMNVDIPLFSLKISKERNSSLILSLVLLVIAVSLYFTIGLLAIPLTIICYILLSLFFYRPNNAS